MSTINSASEAQEFVGKPFASLAERLPHSTKLNVVPLVANRSSDNQMTVLVRNGIIQAVVDGKAMLPGAKLSTPLQADEQAVVSVC